MGTVITLIWVFIIGGAIGFFNGVCYRTKLERKQVIGSLRVDHSDRQDEPYLFLEANGEVADISKRKWVVLMVHTEDFIPHD